MFVTIESAVTMGMKCIPIHVEVDVAKGFPGFDMVGYLSSEVREARQRVMVALKNRGIFMSSMRITVNLAPAHVHKAGTGFDLPIAIGIMTALGYFTQEEIKGIRVIGELGLDGKVKPVKGILPMIQLTKEENIKCCMVPKENLREGAVIPEVKLIGVETLKEAADYLKSSLEQREQLISKDKTTDWDFLEEEENLDFSNLIGQDNAKRGAEIAAAGFHSMLMIGPPGVGKSMIAKRIPGILPPLSLKEKMEVLSVYSVAGLFSRKRPFLHPHHTISEQALIGGGRIPSPGVVSLAHHSVLFLDELGEFKRKTLDLLRQPMEEKEVHIARNFGNFIFPSDFLFIGAMNPCPCGYYPDQRKCHCSETEIRRYLSKVSGPLLDRIDLCVEMSQIPVEEWSVQKSSESSQSMKQRVMVARERQRNRFQTKDYQVNARMPVEDVETFCKLNGSEQLLMKQAMEILGLSFRGYHHVLKVARTIADLEDLEQMKERHLLEALGYRMSYQSYRKG